MAQTINEKIVELNDRVKKAEDKIQSVVSAYELAITDLRNDLGKVITAQREEIIRLRLEIEAERQDRKSRRAKAIAQLKGE